MFRCIAIGLIAPTFSLSSVAVANTNNQPSTRLGRTICWAAPVSGDFTDPNKWQGGVVPGPLDTAVINLAGDYVVNLSSSVTVAHLVTDDTSIVCKPSATRSSSDLAEVTESTEIRSAQMHLLTSETTETTETTETSETAETSGDHLPIFVSTYPAADAVIASPQPGHELIVTYKGNGPDRINPASVSLTTTDGIDLTSQATISEKKLRFDLSTLSEGRHEWIVSVADTQGHRAQQPIVFHIDATPPRTIASHESGAYLAPFVVALIIEDLNGTVYYSTDGYPPAIGAANTKARGGTPADWADSSIEILQTTTLQFFAVDTAGNQEPPQTRTYQLGAAPSPVANFRAVYNESLQRISAEWDSHPVAGSGHYVIYRAISPADVQLLQVSHMARYSPPQPLQRGTTTTQTFFEEPPAAGITVWYGVSVVDGWGQESVISALVPITLENDQAVAATTETGARDKAIAWLLGTQNPTGSWGDAPGRITATSQVLNGLHAAGVHASATGKALFSLRANAPDNSNENLARVIETLDRYHQPTFRLAARLVADSADSHDATSALRHGWGTDSRHHPDPVSTAHALRAVGPVFAVSWTSLVFAESLGAVVPGGARSIYTTALLISVLGANLELESWLSTQRLADGSFQGSIVDTAAAITWGNLEPKVREDAISWLLTQQHTNGSWSSDPFLTGFCLEAIHKHDSPNTFGQIQHRSLQLALGLDGRHSLDLTSDVTFSGSSLRYQWLMEQGPEQILFTSPHQRNTTAQFYMPGSYVIHSVGTHGSAQAKQIFQVEVTGVGAGLPKAGLPLSPAAQTPTIHSLEPSEGAATLGGDGTVRLRFASQIGFSDPSQLKLNWSVLQGPQSVTFSDTDPSGTTALFTERGNYVLQLHVAPKNRPALVQGGHEVQATLSITILPPASPVIPALSVRTVVVGGEVVATGANLPKSRTATWQLGFGPSSVENQNPSYRPVANFIFSAPGQYLMRRVDDDDEHIIYDQIIVNVMPALPSLFEIPPLPRVLAGPDRQLEMESGQESVTVPLAWFALVPAQVDPSQVTFDWHKRSGPGDIQIGDSTTTNTPVTFTEAGDYHLELVVKVAGSELRDQVLLQILPPQSDEVLHWNFEETTFSSVCNGPAFVDQTGNGYEGCVHGEPTFVVDSDGNTSLYFTGEGQGVTASFPEQVGLQLEQYTVSLWVQVTGSGSMALDQYRVMHVLSWGNKERIEVTWDNQPHRKVDVHRAKVPGATLGFEPAPNALVPGQWVHLAVRFDGETIRTFLNGQYAQPNQRKFIAQKDAGTLFQRLRISDPLHPLLHYEGMIDDVRIYRRALTDQELADLHARHRRTR